MTLKEIMFHHKAIRDDPENRKKFNGFFNLNLFDYVDLINGFDTIKLNETLFYKHPNYDTMSMKDMLIKEYGQEATDFVTYLMNIKINPYKKMEKNKKQKITTELRWEHASMKDSIFQTTVFAKFNNEEEEEILLSYYPDEVSFTHNELIGKTKEQALSLFTQKDKNYLQS